MLRYQPNHTRSKTPEEKGNVKNVYATHLQFHGQRACSNLELLLATGVDTIQKHLERRSKRRISGKLARDQEAVQSFLSQGARLLRSIDVGQKLSGVAKQPRRLIRISTEKEQLGELKPNLTLEIGRRRQISGDIIAPFDLCGRKLQSMSQARHLP